MSEREQPTTPAETQPPDKHLPPHERPDFDPMDYIIGIDGRPYPEPWRVRWTRFVAAVRAKLRRQRAA
jgi:hypothetical protein